MSKNKRLKTYSVMRYIVDYDGYIDECPDYPLDPGEMFSWVEKGNIEAYSLKDAIDNSNDGDYKIFDYTTTSEDGDKEWIYITDVVFSDTGKKTEQSLVGTEHYLT